MINLADLKKLRQETGAGVIDVKMALEEADGDIDRAQQILKQKGFDKASKKADREVKAGLVESYCHGGKIGVLVEVLCETDFVARTDDFKNLVHELALQIASMNPENRDELLKQEYIRDNTLTVGDLIRSIIGKVGENIKIGRFSRIELGK